MPDPSPADLLGAAAKLLRDRATAVPSDRWGHRPWHVEECSDPAMGECPCIVAQGERAHWSEAQDPPMQYVADAETAEYATWIALMHPGVGLALADWLEAIVGEMTAADGTEYAYEEYASWTAALTVARQILGGAA
jgi:hypothetical protein